MKKIIALTLVILALVPMLFSCGSKVVVNTNGGDVNVPNIEKAELSDIVSTTPTRDGYVFAGWYSDASFTDYIKPNAITDAQEKAGTAYAKWIIVPESRTYGVRTEECSITDSGRINQKLDKVGIAEDYNITDLIRAGYTSFKVTVKYTACEVDDGYQYVMLYKDENCISSSKSLIGLVDKYVFGEGEEEDPSMLVSHQFEHDPDSANTEWKDYEFEETVKLSDMKEELYIRYGASGNGDDTWKNKDIIVTVVPVK